MSEDRAFVVTFPGGGTRWVIEWADGSMEWMQPHLSVDGASKLQRRWIELWSKESKSIAEHRLAGLEHIPEPES